MKLKYKDMLKALGDIEEERKIPEEVILDALKEAMAKAYKKDAELSDINVIAEINEKTQTIDLFQVYDVVENVEDDELQMDLATAREYKPDAVLNDQVKREIEIESMSRAAAGLARNVMRQKIREAEKVAVYDTYIDQLNEMVIGLVESVKEKFALISLGKTTALMPKSAQIPQERLVEGQKIRVVITEVNKDTKGSQVLVSRADPMLVKRLFEKEVPEISQGIVEIKAIAREPGERTKMAVISYNPEVDPIGACIGQRGSRVQEIIEELHGEKIDIFQWSEDIKQLVKNALAPAEIREVLIGEDGKSLLVIVDEDQLSLAIGKRGKNARLAVKLTGHKIDIKTREELEEEGQNYDEMLAASEERYAKMKQEYEKRRKEKAQEAAAAEDEKRRARVEELARKASEDNAAAYENSEVIPEEMQEVLGEKIRDEVYAGPAEEAKPAEEPVKEEAAPAPVEEKPAEEEAVSEEPEAAVETEAEAEEAPAEAAEPVEEEEPAEEKTEVKAPKKKKVDLEEVAAKNEYVSRFEKLANTSKPKPQAPARRKKKKGEDDGIKTRNEDLLKQLQEKNKNLNIDNKPIYSQEELDEIEREEEEENEKKYDIDYDDYDEYYKDER
ncbi:MAG: transcription termination factor NusA [Bulleidia sp.]|nr:transcription termination factor NusA [Bulleidia sp.]